MGVPLKKVWKFSNYLIWYYAVGGSAAVNEKHPGVEIIRSECGAREMASSINLVFLYMNCRRSALSGGLAQIWVITNISKHLFMVIVRTTGR